MVRHFLESRCGLSRYVRIPGTIVESHHQVLELWRKLIESGALHTPFDVIHVDAHPDLTIRGGLRLISGKLCFEKLEQTNPLEEGYINAGNYLTYAIAYGWIASLTWVPSHLPEYDPVSKKSVPFNTSCGLAVEPNKGAEFKIVQWQNFRATEPFDYVLLSQSPEYTPRKSDELIPLISQYVNNLTLQGL
jgi:hypothetical protein